jgi:hypothetical protein
VTLLIAVLAVFFIWGTVLSVVPWAIPGWLQPLLVYGAALLFVWPLWHFALAVAGGVGLLHVLSGLSSGSSKPQMIRRPGRGPRIPRLP